LDFVFRSHRSSATNHESDCVFCVYSMRLSNAKLFSLKQLVGCRQCEARISRNVPSTGLLSGCFQYVFGTLSIRFRMHRLSGAGEGAGEVWPAERHPQTCMRSKTYRKRIENVSKALQKQADHGIAQTKHSSRFFLMPSCMQMLSSPPSEGQPIFVGVYMRPENEVQTMTSKRSPNDFT